MSRYRKLLLALAGLVVLPMQIAFAGEHPPIAIPGGGELKDVSAEFCKGCHEDIYKQWSGSMHANSTALKDPIHGAFYRFVVGDPQKEGVTKGKKKKYPVCLQCHAPTAARSMKTKLDAKPSYNEGVNCVSCHTMVKYKGVKKPGGGLQLGVKAYEFSDTALQGPNIDRGPVPTGKGKAAEPMHMITIKGNPQQLKTKDACMGCHDQRPNSHGVPLCMTGDEIRLAGGSTTCQSCHMPIVNGKASHAMLGGHDAAMVEHGLAMTMNSNLVGGRLKTEVNLLNKTPHNFPSGAPFRNVYIKVTAYDGDGKAVWQSAKGSPMKEDPQAMLWYALGDEAGKPTAPPKAKQVLSDSRLKPNEERVLKYSIPAMGVKVVRTEAYYNLLLPGNIKKFGDKLPEDVKKPMLVGSAEVRF